MMRTGPLAAVLALLLATPALARLGESPKQCVKRYGEPVSMTEKDDVVIYEYARYGIHLVVAFTPEKGFLGHRRLWADHLVYTRPSTSGTGNEELTPEELQTLLDANSQKKAWRELDPVVEAARFADTDTQVKILRDGDHKTRWRREDGAVAVYDRTARVLDIRGAAPTNKPDGDKRSAAGLEGF
jgi:hypothetical protein